MYYVKIFECIPLIKLLSCWAQQLYPKLDSYDNDTPYIWGFKIPIRGPNKQRRLDIACLVRVSLL